MPKIPQPSHGKQWDGNVGKKLTRGQKEPKPGDTARDTGEWGGNVAPKITTAKRGIGDKSP